MRLLTGKEAPRLGRNTRSVPRSICRSTTQQASQRGIGAPRIGMYEPLPPFIGTWEQMRGNTIGMGKKRKKRKKEKEKKRKKERKKERQNQNIKKEARSATRSQFTVQKRASIKPHIVKAKFHKISQ